MASSVDAGSSSQSYIGVSSNPSISQERTLNLVGDNTVYQTIEGERNGNAKCGAINIIKTTGSDTELTGTTNSYSTPDTHSIDQTINGSGGSGSGIWSVVGAGDIETTGNGIELDPPMTIDIGAEGEAALIGVGAFEHADINATLHVDTGHSAHASGDIYAEGAVVIAGAAAVNVEANAAGTITLTPDLEASGILFLEAEGAIVGGAALGNPLNNAKINASLNADTGHSAHASGDIYAEGAVVIAGAAAGNVEANAAGTIPGGGTLDFGAEGAVVGGWGSWKGIDGIGDPTNWLIDAYSINATSLSAQTSLGAGTSVFGEVTVSGGLYPNSKKAAGVAAGYLFFNPDFGLVYDGQEEHEGKTGSDSDPVSGYGTASVYTPEFDVVWTPHP